MAASATRTNIVQISAGQNGKKMETGVIVFDSDATVEVPTTLTKLQSAWFGATGNGGNANTLSVDETVTNNAVSPANGFVTVDATGNTTNTWFYTFIGV